MKLHLNIHAHKSRNSLHVKYILFNVVNVNNIKKIVNKCLYVRLFFFMCVQQWQFCVQFLIPVESTSGFINTKHEMCY